MGEHTLAVVGSTTDLDRNWMRLRLACDRCDLAGHLAGSPPEKMQRLAEVMAQAHRQLAGGTDRG